MVPSITICIIILTSLVYINKIIDFWVAMYMPINTIPLNTGYFDSLNNNTNRIKCVQLRGNKPYYISYRICIKSIKASVISIKMTSSHLNHPEKFFCDLKFQKNGIKQFTFLYLIVTSSPGSIRYQRQSYRCCCYKSCYIWVHCWEVQWGVDGKRFVKII